MIPALREWYYEYADQGLTIVSVHTPEFEFEKNIASIQNALVELDVPYPVAVDNDWITWRAYGNRYWPAMYFIDRSGNIRHLKIGEGRMAETESVLQALLAEGF